MNIPNALTLSRIFLTLILGALAQTSGIFGAILTLGVFTLAALTDLADGYLARKYHLETAFGKILDPIADKCLILTAMFIFSYEGLLLLWMVMVVAVREILVTAWRIYAVTRNQVIPAEQAGKVKTVFQMTVVSLILLYRVLFAWPAANRALIQNREISIVMAINGLMMVAVVLTVWSGVLFFKRVKESHGLE